MPLSMYPPLAVGVTGFGPPGSSAPTVDGDAVYRLSGVGGGLYRVSAGRVVPPYELSILIISIHHLPHPTLPFSPHP